MRFMDLLRVRQLISASPVTIPFKAPSFFIRLYKISTGFCIEMNTARNINKGISLWRIQFGSEVPSETGYSHIASAFRAVNFADTVNIEKHCQDVGAVVAEHHAQYHTKDRRLGRIF